MAICYFHLIILQYSTFFKIEAYVFLATARSFGNIYTVER